MGRMREGMISIRTFLMVITAFGVFQIFFLLQLNYSNMRQIPNQCDCQCTKQLHVNRDSLRHNSLREKIRIWSQDYVSLNQEDEEVIKDMDHYVVKPPAFVPRKGDEERHRMKILEAEDKALDKEFAANQTKQWQDNIEDPEEKSPYQPEKLNESDTYDKPYARIVPGPLIVNPKINASSLQCSNSSADLLLFYIYTAPGNFEQRRRVRESYGSVAFHDGRRLKFLFFIGGLTEEGKAKYYYELLNESRHFGDLVQDTSYIDAYRNLTLKGMSAMRWVAAYCPNTYRVMKIDDDTMINPYTLIPFLNGQSDITMSELICKVTQGVGPIRNSKSKYFVSEDEYKDEYYPPYCQGYGYIFPPNVIPHLVEAFDKNQPIAMEDVFFTGITSQEIAVRLHPLTALYATTFNKFETFLERITSRPELLMVGHVHEAQYVDIFWQLATKRETTRLRVLDNEKKDAAKAKRRANQAKIVKTK